jgi:hypothetical protein
MPGELLNPTKKTKVTITLRRFEEDLRQALQWLDGYAEEGFLFRRKMDLPPENRELARKNIEAALLEISELAIKLDLEAEVENSARIIWGAMSIDWADLTDIHARDLRGSGAVNPVLAEILDDPVDRLADLAMAIHANFRTIQKG